MSKFNPNNMTAFEIGFYAYGILDANEARRITIPCRSERYMSLSKELNVQIADPRGNARAAYNAGVAYAVCQQMRLELPRILAEAAPA